VPYLGGTREGLRGSCDAAGPVGFLAQRGEKVRPGPGWATAAGGIRGRLGVGAHGHRRPMRGVRGVVPPVSTQRPGHGEIGQGPMSMPIRSAG
jgi:hypothetical protein